MTSSVVHLTDDAAFDLEEICDYIARHDSPGRAEHVLERIEGSFNRLAEHPRRGSYPKELLEIGIREYREVFFKPCRIIRFSVIVSLELVRRSVGSRRCPVC